MDPLGENLEANRKGHRYATSDEALEPTYRQVRAWQAHLESTGSEWRSFLAAMSPSDRAVWGLFQGDFRSTLAGARVLEFGAGRGPTAAAMALLGADVLAVDLSEATEAIVARLAERFDLTGRLRGWSGDIRALPIDEDRYDYVVGLNVLHHLTLDLETEVMRIFTRMLKPEGRAVFIEPCENSAFLKRLKDRVAPEDETHPERPNDSRHYRAVGERHFHEVAVEPYGSLERLAPLAPGGRANGRLRARLLSLERALPAPLHDRLAASQRMVFARPRP